MTRRPGITRAASRTAAAARGAAARAWRGLIQVLTGSERPPAWRWRTPQDRRAAYVVLWAATGVLFVFNLVGSFAAPGQLLLALPVVAPLPLAARSPLLAWRVGWLALLLVPLVPADWWGAWPWGPGQVFALLGVLCVAGVRYQRPVLWWMCALTLIPWCFWLVVREPDLNGPIAATLIFTVLMIAMDNVGSRLRAQGALAAQTERTEAERARRAVLEERTRIARELHDVVAHHMSLIAVRAETAPNSARSARWRARR